MSCYFNYVYIIIKKKNSCYYYFVLLMLYLYFFFVMIGSYKFCLCIDMCVFKLLIR